MRFELVTPAASLASYEASSVRLPGTEGEFGVLPGHQPLLSTLRPGMLMVEASGSERIYAIGYGFVDVSPKGVTVMVEEAIAREDIDRSVIQTRLEAIAAELEGLDEKTDAGRFAALTKEQEVLQMQVLVAEATN